MSTRFLFICLLLVLAEFYSYQLFASFTRNLPSAQRAAVIIAYFLVSAATWATPFFFRDLITEKSAIRNVLFAFVMGWFVAKILVLAVLLIDDLRRLSLFVLDKIVPQQKETPSRSLSRSFFLRQLAVVLAGLSVGGFVYGIRNRYRYHVRKVSIGYPNLPDNFKGLRVVQLSDIHTGSFDNHEAVAAGIKKVMDQKPDIIFFTGDLVNNVATEVDEGYQEIFSRLKAPLGVYSILGNHDYGDYVSWDTEEAKSRNLDNLKLVHKKAGWKLLLNEHVILERGDQKIGLLGIENWGAKAHFAKYGDLGKAWKGVREQNLPFHILLSHDPSHWDAQVRPEFPAIDLTLSGHTHGMQFGIDSKIFKWSPVQYVYHQWAGLYQQGKQYLYVNRGFGVIGYPGRLGILPEITVIELV